jgi:hypothetical protein
LCVTLKVGDDRWHCFEDEDNFVPHPALLEHLTQKYKMVFGVKRQVRTDDNPSLARAQKDLWHIWEAPVRLEFKNIDDMNVKEPIRFEDIPRGAQVLQLIMNLSTKRYSSGDIEKLKARLLLLGNHEWETFEETFSPTAAKETLLFFIALLVLLGIPIHEMDIVAAFLYSELEEPVYCRLPPECRDAHGNFIYWKLLKALYGMRRAPRLFFETFTSKMIEGAYVQTPFDTCMFSKFAIDGHFILIAFHVDNIYYGATNPALADEFDLFMASNFRITRNDTAANILGMMREINEDQSSTLSMPMIVKKLVTKCFGQEEFTTQITPMSATFTDEFADDADKLSPADITWMRGALGLVVQLVPIRPDIAYAHGKLASRLLHSTRKDMDAAKRISRYIAFTNLVLPSLGLTFHPAVSRGDPRDASVPLSLHSDYSHNCHPDSKGHGGIGASMGDGRSGLFQSRSKKLATVTDSTTAGEIAVAVSAVKKFEWMRQVLEYLHLKRPPAKFFVDNASMQAVCTKITGATKRLRHMLLHINFVLERTKAGLIECVLTPSNQMLIDALTKPVPPATHWTHMPGLLGTSEAMEAKCEQAWRIIRKEEALPTASLAAIDVMDEGTRADQLLKRPRAAQEPTTTLGSPFPRRFLRRSLPVSIRSTRSYLRCQSLSQLQLWSRLVAAVAGASMTAALQHQLSQASIAIVSPTIKPPSDKRRKGCSSASST